MWLVAGSLHVGDLVRLLDGGTATVVALYALPGVGPMWDLSLDSVHTFAVGDVQAVVHNTSVLQGLITTLLHKAASGRIKVASRVPGVNIRSTWEGVSFRTLAGATWIARDKISWTTS